MSGVGEGKESEGSELLIAAVGKEGPARTRPCGDGERLTRTTSRPAWIGASQATVMTHFAANRSGSGCHHFEDAFRPGTPWSSREVESA